MAKIPRLVLSALLMLGAGLSLAATPTPTPTPTAQPDVPGTYIEYRGEQEYVNYNQFTGEVGDSTVHDRTVRISCVEDECVLTGLGLGRQVEFPISGSTLEVSIPEEGTVCESDNYISAGTMTVVATAESIAVETETIGSAVTLCPNETYRWAQSSTLVATYVSGDACVLEGASCAAAPEPEVGATAPRTPSSPSVLSTLATPADTLSPAQIALAVGLTLVLVILMALPTQLLNGAVEKGSDRIAPLLAKVTVLERFKRRPDATPSEPRVARTYPGLLPGLAGVLAAALISSFVDPAFGFDPASLRAFASVALAFSVEVVAGWFVVIWAVRRARPDAAASISFVPATLLVVLATVIFSRVTGFEPGIVFGLVAGVAFGVSLATAERARAALVGVGFSFAVAIVSWLGYTALSGIVDAGTLVVFARETLAALTIAGIAAVPLALVPLRGLIGHELWSWNRLVWAGAYALGVLAFFLVLMPLPLSWETVQTSLVSWITLYLIYAALAVGLWLAIVRPWSKVKAGVAP